MKKVLITGGTVFVSRYIAEYYVAKGYEVYVLNRNSRKQSVGVSLIEADRQNLGSVLRGHHFDIVIDTGYTADDVANLLNALDAFDDYIFISSSAVYPEYAEMPFKETADCAVNRFWGMYGIHKINAEKILLERNPNAYILRPPYLYGTLNNVYREAFVFDCALADREFYLPGNGEMKIQFFHVFDLCRCIDALVENRPKEHIFNVGNKELVTIREWVSLCYRAAGKVARFQTVPRNIEQRNYFCFYDYEYFLDTSLQCKLIQTTKPLEQGLAEAFAWYVENFDTVNKKPLIEYIDTHLVRNTFSEKPSF